MDGEGGYTVYGLAENANVSREENLIPIGIADGISVKRRVKADVALTYDDVELNEESFALWLRKIQEATIRV